jgi:hypothetical protein
MKRQLGPDLEEILGTIVKAISVMCLAVAPAMASDGCMAEGPDGMDPVGIEFSVDTTTATIDPGIELFRSLTPSSDSPTLNRLPSRQECMTGCRERPELNTCPGGGVLFDGEPSEGPNGEPRCKCIYICYKALKWLI